MSLSGKHVLLLSPEFFGYGREMAAELTRMGATVDAYDTRPDNSATTKVALRVAPTLLRAKSAQYHHGIIRQAQHYDFVLVVRGEGLTPDLLRAYRQRFARAKFIYYTYDSLSENPLFFAFGDLFDRCYSFDPVDVQQHPDLTYKPLFYIRRYGEVGDMPYGSRTWDVSFVGTFRADRYATISRIVWALPPGLSSFFFFYHPNQAVFQTLRWLSGTYRSARPDTVHFKPLPPQEVSRILEQSKAVIDVQKPHQSGLTMRTIEMVGAQRKLITTNPLVAEHDFFNSNNICLVDVDQPLIPDSFFSRPYQPLEESVRTRYSLQSWLEQILV